jgi:glycosyltransferase involved in cell wall biosynthesis
LDPSKGDEQLPVDVNFDCILSQNNFAHFHIAQKLSKFLHLPIVSLTHTLPPPNDVSNYNYLDRVKQMSGDVNVFISEFSRASWGWNEDNAKVVHHGIDTERLFKPNPRKQREKHILSVVNDWKNRDWCCGYSIWERATKGLPVKVLGDNPGLSEPAKSLTDLINNYQGSRIFLNTSTVSPVPTSLLEAASCGCAIVSTNTCMIPEIFSNGKDAYLTNDERAMRIYLEKLLADPGLAQKMGEAARRTVQEKFALKNFVNNWNNVLEEASNLVFKG